MAEMNVTAYRTAYFGLCKALGLDDDMRHAFNRAITGKESSRDWTVQEWRNVVAELQRRNGQSVAPGRPHIRGKAEGGRRRAEGTAITPAQLEYIESLVGRIAWRVGPAELIRSRLLNPFRRDSWDGQYSSLTRREAANIITVFRRMAGASDHQDTKTPRTATEEGTGHETLSGLQTAQ